MIFLITALSLWVSWYVWRFHLTPWLHPDEPRELPYLVPCELVSSLLCAGPSLTPTVVGHIYPMFTNSHALYTRARLFFHNRREPFAITVMGDSAYVITSPEDVLAVHRKPRALDYNPFIKDILASQDMNEFTLEKMFQRNAQSGKAWMDVAHENFRSQMIPGQNLEIVWSRLLSAIDGHFKSERLQGPMVLGFNEHNEQIVSLYRWTYEVLVDSGTRAFFDESLNVVAPDLLNIFWIFEQESWKLPFRLPRFAASKMYQTKSQMERALARYFKIAKDKRPGESWLVRTTFDQLTNIGVDEQQICVALFTFYRTMNTNAYKLAFWLASFLIFNPESLKSVREEIDAAFDSNGVLDQSMLDQSMLDQSMLKDSCPVLDAMYNELLRTKNWPIGPRTVTKPVTIGGKRLQPGRKVLMAYRQMHVDPSVFGDNVNDFNAQRFRNDKSLIKSPSFRPSGRASTYCPGRFIAKREIFLSSLSYFVDST